MKCGRLPRAAYNDTSCIVCENTSSLELNCNYIVKNRTKNYRRKELSRISPSVIYGLSDPGEHLLSVGDLVW